MAKAPKKKKGCLGCLGVLVAVGVIGAALGGGKSADNEVTKPSTESASKIDNTEREKALADFYKYYLDYMAERETNILDFTEIADVKAEPENGTVNIIYSNNIRNYTDDEKKVKFKTVLGNYTKKFKEWKETSDYNFEEGFYPYLAFYDQDGNIIALTDPANLVVSLER